MLPVWRFLAVLERLVSPGLPALTAGGQNAMVSPDGETDAGSAGEHPARDSRPRFEERREEGVAPRALSLRSSFLSENPPMPPKTPCGVAAERPRMAESFSRFEAFSRCGHVPCAGQGRVTNFYPLRGSRQPLSACAWPARLQSADFGEGSPLQNGAGNPATPVRSTPLRTLESGGSSLEALSFLIRVVSVAPPEATGVFPNPTPAPGRASPPLRAACRTAAISTGPPAVCAPAPRCRSASGAGPVWPADCRPSPVRLRR